MTLAACTPPSDSSPLAGASSSCGTLQKARFEEAGLPARDYYVYVPCSLAADARAPLVVYLHGCRQTGTDGAIQTRWPKFADAHGLIAVFPEQFNPNSEPVSEQQVMDHVSNGNGASCWNWFRPEQIQRGAGEVATIAGITQRVIAEHHVDPDRVFVTGISAGGAMAGAMAANYPDLYAATAIVSAVPFEAGTDASGALAAQAMGERARPMPVLVVHGTADEVAPFAAGVATVQEWLGANDFIDDGVNNGSIARTPASSEDYGVDPSALAGAGTVGDVCVDREGSPCPGGALGMQSYPYTIQHYVDAAGAPLVDFWIIHGLMHNYVSGDPSVNWSDPLGPDITQAAYEFFTQHPR